jgi:hypothetical protein
MSDLNFQAFSTVQPEKVVVPKTLASANVIAPSGFLTILTGNTVVKTITPPLLGVHMLCIIFAGVAGVDASDNVATARGTVASQALLFVYNPIDAHYYVVGSALA